MPPSLSSPLVALLLLLLTTTNTTTSATFPNCTTNFSCGPFHNLTAPPRPSHCGLPQFHLTCTQTHADLTAYSLTYRVLTLNPTHQTLTLSRSDLSTTTCPTGFFNTTLDPTFFQHGTGNPSLRLLLPPALYQLYPLNLFSYVVSRVNNSNNPSDAFYLVGPLPIDLISHIINRCVMIVTVPVSGVFTIFYFSGATRQRKKTKATSQQQKKRAMRLVSKGESVVPHCISGLHRKRNDSQVKCEIGSKREACQHVKENR